MVYLEKNPFVWSDNSAAITSPVLDVSVKDSRGNTVEMGQLMDDIEFSNHMQGMPKYNCFVFSSLLINGQILSFSV